MAKKILLSGNEAIAEGAVQAGCQFYAGYPITPQNELTAYMAKRLTEIGRIFIQSEAEVSAINMVFGASAAGVRAMTSSSSPGISLKQEGISYIAGAELPAVIVNIMRAGPGLGNIWPSQADYFQATRGGGHGDYRVIVLAPSSVQEAYDQMFLAFDLADKYRSPVMVLGDGLLGQMMEPVIIENRVSKAEHRAKPWALTGCKGRNPNIAKSFFMREGDLETANIKLQKKYNIIQKHEERYEELFTKDAKIIIVAYGTMARIAKGLVKKLRRNGIKIGLIRPISLWPFPAKIFKQLIAKNKHLTFLAVEMSYGQMVEDVRLSVEGKAKVEFFGRSGGGVPLEGQIAKKVKTLL